MKKQSKTKTPTIQIPLWRLFPKADRTQGLLIEQKPDETLVAEDHIFIPLDQLVVVEVQQKMPRKLDAAVRALRAKIDR